MRRPISPVQNCCLDPNFWTKPPKLTIYGQPGRELSLISVCLLPPGGGQAKKRDQHNHRYQHGHPAPTCPFPLPSVPSLPWSQSLNAMKGYFLCGEWMFSARSPRAEPPATQYAYDNQVNRTIMLDGRVESRSISQRLTQRLERDMVDMACVPP